MDNGQNWKQVPDIPEGGLTGDGVAAFLASGYVPGIGAARARKITDVFGTGALSALLRDPEGVASACGISVETVSKAAAALSELKQDPQFLAFLFSAGVSAMMVERILGKYRSRAKERVLTDPYSMVEDVWQLSFFTAERIGKALGIAPDNPARVEAALVTAVKLFSEQGHLFAPIDEALGKGSEISGQPPGAAAEALKRAEAHGRLVVSMDGVYIPVFYTAEKEVSEKLALLSEPIYPQVEASSLPETGADGVRYTDAQKEAMAKVLSAPVSVITGGPGTGKTTVVRGIIDQLEKSGAKIALVAPTGMAAKRMEKLSGHPASTIHRLLGWGGESRHRVRKLDLDAIVIDEGSMLEQVLFNHLLDSLSHDCRIIIVGDVEQLPAIGAGDVMRGLIESRRVAVAELDENFRQKSGSLIARGAEAINRCEVPLADASKDFMILSEKGSKAIKKRILDLVAAELPEKRGIDPFDIQVVTPQQIGDLGARQLNADLQERLNPDAPALVRGQSVFKVGDPVMQTSNSRERGLYNGERGRIVEVNTESQTLTVDYPDAGRSVYRRSELSELTLAYAVTVHKLQGSEVANIVFPVTMAHKPMLYRNLLYTGVSRARNLCVLVGEEEALRHAVDNNGASQRHSNFSRRLQADILPSPLSESTFRG